MWLNGGPLSYGTLGIREVFSARAGIENFCFLMNYELRASAENLDFSG